METTIRETINNAIDEKVELDGNVNLSILTKALESFRVDMLKDLKAVLPADLNSYSSVNKTLTGKLIVANSCTFTYDGKM